MTMVAGLLFTACEEDGTGGGVDTDAPAVTLTGADLTVSAGDTVYVDIAAVEGASPINTLTITENDVDVPLDRLLFDGAPASSNPQLILDASAKVSFNRQVGVIAPATPDVYTYQYVVTDEDNRSSSQSIVVTVVAEPPSFEIAGDGDIQTSPGTLASFMVTGSSNGIDMDMISVAIDGEPVAEFDFAGTTVTNPYTLLDADRTSFETNLLVRAPDAGGTYTVEVTVTDAIGQTSSDQIIFVNGTTAADYMDRIFFNAIGSGNGAMDLDTGESVSSSSMESEIQDDGIDDTVDPMVVENWFASFSPENGAELFSIVPGENNLTENFTFEGVRFQEDVRALESNGTNLTTSGTVEQGDLFLVKRADNFYLILIDEVNAVFGSNEDNYVIDIKLGQ